LKPVSGVSEAQRRIGYPKQALAISPAEYWGFLGAAALIAVVVMLPRQSSQSSGLSRRRRTGTFGTTVSSDEPSALQHSRAREPDRGRHADAPWQIPWRGWKDILWRTYQQIGEDRVVAVAAGVVFYGLLALFPAIAAFVSLYSLFAKASTINDHLAFAVGILPSGAVDIIRDQVTRLVSKGDVKLSFGFIVGVGTALWSANAGMKALMDALNLVYDEKEKRGFFKLNLVSLTFTLAAITSMLFAFGVVVALPLLLSRVGLGALPEFLFQILRWPGLLALVMVGLAVIYRFGPSRREPRWQWISVGCIVAAIAWLASSALLSLYMSSFANYDATYGSLGAAIGMMMWIWISVIVILFGAELNSEIEHQTARDSTIKSQKPLGARGAVMADTIGPAAGEARFADLWRNGCNRAELRV
jgi:membrane protein